MGQTHPNTSSQRASDDVTIPEAETQKMTVLHHFALDSDEAAPEAKHVEVAMLGGRLDAELLAMLQAADEFTPPPEGSADDPSAMHKHMSHRGYFACRDPGQSMQHRYFEGYFHGLAATGEAVEAINPRFGREMDKPAAPVVLRAFLSLFRTMNADWLKSIADDLNAALADSATTTDEEVLSTDAFFADCAAQHHHGDAVDITPDSFTGWHCDAANSLLHLAISLCGTRRLHYRSGLGPRSQHHYVASMTAGDMYLTSPFLFEHAVEYPECDLANRILAVQCRIHLSPDTLQRLYLVRPALLEACAVRALEAARARPPTIPTAAEVCAVMTTMMETGDQASQ